MVFMYSSLSYVKATLFPKFVSVQLQAGNTIKRVPALRITWLLNFMHSLIQNVAIRECASECKVYMR
jgi:hypothetical protein